ncbi:hypothetical protein Mal64_33690 [Pseudobythopirellula maris]|uniref:Uncharacterized protein n=1 Tax=Pseudobythopirellula maris TaxID=2527991 RepID=A0A5C5ZJ33_9BACT|nr:PEP-CTERM sorting domain-containing protein [Pseudobythopirellula maris]TWT86543.1 hypothetical protein Mal64_33690 [Pseudobythopirellula maris]
MASVLVALAAAYFAPCGALAVTTLYQENFDSLQLQPSVDEIFPFPRAFTHQAPPGWIRDASDVPGVNSPDVGVFEWEGWSFAHREFWTDVNKLPSGAPSGREEFHLGQGTIAVADPDSWNDLGDPANTLGFYNTFLTTPRLPLDVVESEEQLRLVFDSSWKGGCCDDGEEFDPNGNNQTGVIRVRTFDANNTFINDFEVLRWESDPANPPLPGEGIVKTDNFNERVYVDLLDLGGVSLSELVAAASTGGAASFEVEFGMEDAGDDGWWGVDNVEMAAYSLLLGDMNLSGDLDAGDIDDFALALLDFDAYRMKNYGEFPVTRGSLDGRFDFDDIDWFVGLMEGKGFSSVSQSLSYALAGVPEPSSGAIALVAIGAAGVRRRLGPRDR